MDQDTGSGQKGIFHWSDLDCTYSSGIKHNIHDILLILYIYLLRGDYLLDSILSISI